ncbi:MAG: T9SS type A sorting domain-containing protein, partial [bacterium]
FHVFRVDRRPGEIRWYVDGVHYQTRTQWWSSGGSFPAPFNQRFHILLNLAVGGNWPGNPDNSTTFPQRLEVDYVRVYKDPALTGIEATDVSFLPQAFALHQNYPNPFNARTLIRYDLPQPDFVILEIYNTSGQKIVTLANQQQPAGQYLIQFDGDSLSSAVYFCRLQTSRFQHAIKLLLMK